MHCVIPFFYIWDMEKPKIRKEMLGVKTSSKTLSGSITVQAHHAEMFHREGRFDLLELPGSLALENVIEVKPKTKKKKSSGNDSSKSE